MIERLIYSDPYRLDHNRMATKKEIDSLCVEHVYKDKTEGKSGFVLEQEINDMGIVSQKVAKDIISGVVIGPSGSGKSNYVLAAQLFDAISSGESFFVNDPSRELLNLFSGFLKENDYEVICFDLRKPQGNCWNPLDKANRLYKEGRKEEAEMLVNEFAEHIFTLKCESTEDKTWIAGSVSLFYGCWLLAINLYDSKKVNLKLIRDIYNWGVLKPKGNYLKTNFQELFNNSTNPEIKKAESYIAPNVNINDGTASSIKFVFMAGINSFARSSIFDATDFDISKANDGKLAIFLVSKDESSEENTYANMILTNVYTSLVDIAENNEDTVGLTRPFTFLLDETGNFGKLDCLNNLFTNSRKRNIKVFVYMQSLSQLEFQGYSKSECQFLLENSMVICYLRSHDFVLRDFVASYIGNVDDHIIGKKALISTEEINRLREEGEAIILVKGQFPFFAKYNHSSTYKLPKLKVEYKERNSCATSNLKPIMKEALKDDNSSKNETNKAVVVEKKPIQQPSRKRIELLNRYFDERG